MQVAALCAGREAFAVKPFRPVKVGLIQTVLPGVKDSVLAKTVKVTEARLARSGSRVTAERRTAHDEARRRRGADRARPRQRHGGDVRGIGDERSRRRHPGGDPAGRRRGHPRGHAGRSRQSDRGRQVSRQAGARRAGLRPQPQGERLRLGARPADRRHRRQRRRHRRARRRRAADGNPDAAAAARDRPRSARRRASMPSCWPPAARAAWAGRTSCWRCSTAGRWCGSPPRRRAPAGQGRSWWSPAIRTSAWRPRSPGSTSGVPTTATISRGLRAR